jgi:hypothetical protein
MSGGCLAVRAEVGWEVGQCLRQNSLLVFKCHLTCRLLVHGLYEVLDLEEKDEGQEDQG